MLTGAAGWCAEPPATASPIPGPTLEKVLPEWLQHGSLLGSAPWQWLGAVLAVGASYLAGVALAWVALTLARRLSGPARAAAIGLFLGAARRPLRILIAAVIFREAIVPLRVSSDLSSGMAQVSFSLIVLTIAWFTIRALRSSVTWASRHLRAGPEHEIRHRVLRTQLTLLRQMGTAAVVLVAMGAVLMQFAFVRSVGLSLLASAGLVGIVIGFAAQKPLSALIGGLQLSITQPIRIGDTVFIEKELGTVEKIRLTFVVVRLREQRMLVVPISRFLDFPFENWTLAAPDVIGSVLLAVDFTTPLSAVRAALARACANHPGWDRKTCSLEVTDSTEHTMTLRALVSSADAARNWALRCFVREQLIMFLGELDGGTHLPHDRITNTSAALSPSLGPSKGPEIAKARA